MRIHLQPTAAAVQPRVQPRMPVGEQPPNEASRTAWQASTWRLSTGSNSPEVARAMLDVAQRRHWQTLRVSGHEVFKRQVWLEASLRGLTTLGYEPGPRDWERLQQTREGRQDTGAGTVARQGEPGHHQLLAAVEALLLAKKLTAPQRAAVMEAVVAATDRPRMPGKSTVRWGREPQPPGPDRVAPGVATGIEARQPTRLVEPTVPTPQR